MRVRKTKIKKAIELLKQRGVVLSADEVERALNGQVIVNDEDHKKFDRWCQYAWSNREPFVVNFNSANEHPVFHKYRSYRNLLRHISSVHSNRKGSKRKLVVRIKRKRAEPVIGA